jgi:hypothetical protein
MPESRSDFEIELDTLCKEKDDENTYTQAVPGL